MPNITNPPVKKPAMISCDRVGVHFEIAEGRRVKVLDELDLQVNKGEIVTLLGHSGCGKSTLLRSIAGLQKVSTGIIQIEKDNPSTLAMPIGFVFQEPALLDWRTVWQNVRLPFELQPSHSSTEVDRRLDELLAAVSLTPADYQKRPDQLSGGMKMRVALARALALSPQILLLDEPFAALDDVLRNQLNDLLLELWHAQKITILFVTHNIAEAIYLSHRIAVMHQGKIAKFIDIPFPFPRTRDLRGSSEFAKCYGEVSTALESHNRLSKDQSSQAVKS